MVSPMTLFTPEDLVRYLYHESTPQEAAAIETALQQDWTLREKFEVLRKSVASLDKSLVSPRTETVLNVLNYARETAVESV
jgi:HPt (histidine-containing phosphotransfer) domain-containing protein